MMGMSTKRTCAAKASPEGKPLRRASVLNAHLSREAFIQLIKKELNLIFDSVPHIFYIIARYSSAWCAATAPSAAAVTT